MARLLVALGVALAWTVAGGCAGVPHGPLAAAAAADDVAALRALLAAGHRVDDTGPDGLTALIWAARAGALGAIRALLDAGADPNRRDARAGWPPLLHALHARQAPAVRLLLERGANPSGGAESAAPLPLV